LVSTFSHSRAAVENGAGPYVFDGDSQAVDLIDESLQQRDTFAVHAGTGSGRSAQAAGARKVAGETAGSLWINPSPHALSQWLPRILGSAAVDGVYAVSQTLPACGVMIDRVSQVFIYRQCYVSRAVLRSGAGRLLELQLDLAGVDCVTQNSDTFPSVAPGNAAADQPYRMEDALLTMGGAARDFSGFELTVNNHLQPRFVHSVSATSIRPGKRSITLKTVHPFDSSSQDLREQSAAGAAGSITLLHPAGGTTFNFARLLTPATGPVLTPTGHSSSGVKTFVLELNSTAAASGGIAGVEVTHGT